MGLGPSQIGTWAVWQVGGAGEEAGEMGEVTSPKIYLVLQESDISEVFFCPSKKKNTGDVIFSPTSSPSLKARAGLPLLAMMTSSVTSQMSEGKGGCTVAPLDLLSR